MPKKKVPKDIYPSPHDPDVWYTSYPDAVKATESRRELEGHIKSEQEKEEKKFKGMPWGKRNAISSRTHNYAGGGKTEFA